MIALNLQNPDGKVTTEQYIHKEGEEGSPLRTAKQDGVLSFGIVSSDYANSPGVKGSAAA